MTDEDVQKVLLAEVNHLMNKLNKLERRVKFAQIALQQITRGDEVGLTAEHMIVIARTALDEKH